MDHVSKHRFSDNHLSKIFSRVPGKSFILGGVSVGGLPAGESRGVDVGEREDPLGRGAVTRGASDHHGSSVHHLKIFSCT